MNRNSKVPKIGIISGVGPLAGADVLRRVFQYAAQAYGAVDDIDYPEVVLVSSGIEGVDSTGVLSDKFKTKISSAVYQLEVNEVTVIGIACNTAHVYFDSLDAMGGVELLNLIDQVALEASKEKHKYLLLTSAASKQQSLYRYYLEKYNILFEETTKAQQRVIDKAISHVMAYRLEQAGELFDTILSEAQMSDVKGVIAGCTELPIAIDNAKQSHSLFIVNSNAVLAKALVDSYYSQLS